MAALLGMLTGIGGGIVRDLLVARTPVVLRSDLYALAALAGAVLVVVGHGLNWPVVPTAIAGAARLFRASPDGDPVRLEFTSRPADRKRGREETSVNDHPPS